MHSTLVRVQNVFGFFTTVAFLVGGLVALSVLVSPQTPSADIAVRNVQVVKGRPHYYSTKKEEYAHVRFDLNADLTSLFNWNTKQLFVYVLATWPSTNTSAPPDAPASSAVIWDTIMPAPASPSRNYLAALISSYTNPSTTKSSSSSKKNKNKSSKRSKSPKKQEGEGPQARAGVLTLSNQRAKYQITDISGQLANVQNATLELGWNVQPWVGALLWTGSGTGTRAGTATQAVASLRWLDGVVSSVVSTVARWEPLKGARSEGWSFPELKGAKTSTPAAAAAGEGEA